MIIYFAHETQKQTLFSPATHKHGYWVSQHPRTNLERKEGRGTSTCLVLTVALPLTEQPQTPTLGPIPSFFFFFFFNTNTCPRCLDPVAAGNQTAEWAKETTPCVWAAPGKAVNSHSEPAASRQGRVLVSPAHPPRPHQLQLPQTDPPLQTPDDWRQGVTFFYEDKGLGQLCHSSEIWDPRKVLTGAFPPKENWGAPLHNWVRKEKQSHDETRSISLNHTLRT